MAPNPTAIRPTKRGRTKRDVPAHVHVVGVRGARTIVCTVPKGTPVAMHGGAWFVAELDWLERCEEEKLIAAGRPSGQGRATMTYHWAKDAGIRVDAADVSVASAQTVKRR